MGANTRQPASGACTVSEWRPFALRWNCFNPEASALSFHLFKPSWELHGYGKLPQAAAAQTCSRPELPKLTFQAIRKTMAARAQKKVTVTDVQGCIRLSSAEAQRIFESCFATALKAEKGADSVRDGVSI